MSQGSDSARSLRLEEILTDWDVVRDPGQFVWRYASAVQHYFTALLKNVHDAEEAAQDFFLRVVRHGFFRVSENGGRFRDYLKTAVRNAATNFLNRRKPQSIGSEVTLLTAVDRADLGADVHWLMEWRLCLLERACQSLARHQSQAPKNLFHTVLGMIIDHPLEDVKTLAARTATLVGRPLGAAAFRKQVSRARRALALLLAQEVAQTLDRPTPEELRDELIELGLWTYVRDYLPDDWATNPSLFAVHAS